jgi:sialate O-acetylesterase
MRAKMFVFIILLVVGNAAVADVRLPAIFSNNMVLQQQTTAPIWGWAAPGEKVSLTPSWGDPDLHTVTGPDGKWMLSLKTPKAGGPFTLTFRGHNELEVKNVLVGEVWICSGQSNMQFTMGKGQRWYTGDINESTEAPAARYWAIRLCTVTPKYSDTPQDDCNASWQPCTPETVKTFSAVGYYFGRELNQKLQVPIGLITTAYGGTMAEAWTSRQGLSSEPEFAAMLSAYDKDKTEFVALRKDYDKQQAAWEAAKAKAAAESKPFDQSSPKKPVRVPNQNSPTVLWNSMVSPIVPFAMKGVIWYQGESNHLRSWEYTRLFPLMVSSWRKDWHQGDFPFYFVQIAPYKDMNPEIREAQRLSFAKIPNCGMVVTTDVGNCSDIHPRNKGPVGARLANWAFARTYGLKDIDYCGPMYKSMKVDGSKIVLSFDYADGLRSKAGDLTGFVIAGKDQKFVPAKAKVDGTTVVVWSDEVKDPAAVRFGWTACPDATLFNKAGLAASPFKTDDWKWDTADAVKKAG